jgi:type IV pilus assembly protein PilY1
MSASYRTLLAAAALLLIQGRAASEDIELFLSQNDDTDPPAVLFVIDNGANFSSSAATGTCTLGGATNTLAGTAGGMEQCALHQVIEQLPENSVRIGVMVWNDPNVVDYQNYRCNGTVDNVPDPSTPGGCLVYPIKLMDDINKAEILAWIRSWRATSGSVPGQIKGNTKRTGAAMQEAWAYYEGRMGLSGYDYANDQPDPTCNRFIIYIGNSLERSGSPGDGGAPGPRAPLESATGTRKDASPAATMAQRLTIGRTYTTTCGTVNLGSGPHENNGYYADEWARYVNETHDITTYTIGVLNPRTCQASYAGTLTSMASVGGGKYFPTTNFTELVIAVQTALSEMLAVNSVFASVSLPVSVNTQGTYLNQVYVGMFRPDEAARSRWHGNMKQYRLGLVNGALRLLDARDPGQPAISGAGSGLLSPCALSYWTPTTNDTYWQTYKNRQPFCGTDPAVSNSPDGALVEKGAQGYVLRDSATAGSISRGLKTCNASCGPILADFDDANTAITETLLGNSAMSPADRTNLINWARGQNNRGDEVDPDNIQLAAATAMRPSVHGDVLHSRPVAINYGSPSDNPPKVVVFYGGNDGVLRAVNGNRSADIADVPAGAELWSFMPPEFYPHIKQLRDNNQQIFFRGEDEADRATRKEKPYGFDGPLTAYRTTDATTTWIFAGLRRGGRMLYAFDVSGLTNTTPTAPTLKWRIGCPNLGNDTGCTSSDIAGIGQTWSSPVVIKANDPGANSAVTTDDVVKPMLIMGGGYDDCEDSDPHTCASPTADPDTLRGNRVFVLDADDGEVLASFETQRPVVGDVFVISNPTTGRAQWAYAADTGGNIYRISGANANAPIGNTYPDDWTMTRIAALGCDDGGTCSANRKFLYAPDVVVEPEPNSGTHILLIGSGDREKPVLTYDSAYATDNYFYMVIDRPTDNTWLTTDMGDCSVGEICMDDDVMLEIERDDDNPTEADLSDKKGWFLELAPHEQVVTSAITVFGGVTFSTHIPTVPEPGACSSDLGTANVYNVRYRNAAPSRPGALNRYEEIEGGGLPPSPVAGQVRLDDGTIVPFIIGADPSSPLEGGLPVPPSLATQPKSITYWYIEKR